jgi:hypothetical protein
MNPLDAFFNLKSKVFHRVFHRAVEKLKELKVTL